MYYYYIFVFIKYCLFFIFFVLFEIKKTIYSIFLLIFIFICGASFFILFNAYFLGFLIIIVYIGAIAVLFLFVCMLINIKDDVYSVSFYKVLINFFIFLGCKKFFNYIYIATYPSFEYYVFYNILSFNNNISVIGTLLYTTFFIDFMLISFILFTSLIGVIILIQLKDLKIFHFVV